MGDNQTEDIHAAYLHWMEEASAYRLAELADCGAPDSKLSLGAEILGEVRDAVIQAWRAGRFDYDTDRFDDDLVTECAEEGIIPTASHEIVALFADLAAWQEESEFTEKGEWEGSFIDMFKDAISQITERAAYAFVRQVRSDFDQHFICPECGDTGTPHICYPGECNDPPECPTPDCTHEDNTPRCAHSNEYDNAASLVCGDCGGDGAECADGCVYRDDEADTPAEAVLTGPVDLPADPFRGHPDYAGEDWQRDYASPVSAVLNAELDAVMAREVPVSDPILDLITAHERQSPGDETSRFLANMAKVNELEFASQRRRRWARWVFFGLALAGLVVAYVVI